MPAGAYASAPIWGRIVDLRGPRIVLIISCVFVLGGYSGIKYFYDSGLAHGTNTLPALSFYILVLCSFLTGAGSLGGLTGAMNTTVKSFPDELVSENGGATPIVMMLESDPFFSASIHNWSRSCGLWIIGIFFYHSFQYPFEKHYLDVPSHPRIRHIFSDGPGRLLCSSNAAARTIYLPIFGGW